MDTEPSRGVSGLGRIAQHLPRGLSRPVPDDRQAGKLLDREIPFQQVRHLGIDPGFLPPAREFLLGEVDLLCAVTRLPIPASGSRSDNPVNTLTSAQGIPQG